MLDVHKAEVGVLDRRVIVAKGTSMDIFDSPEHGPTSNVTRSLVGVMQYICQVARWLWALDTRILEFTFGVLIFLRGLVLWIEPEAMAGATYTGFVEIMSVKSWATLFLLAGVFQLTGIIINGNWRRSPWLRFTGAFIGSICYAMLATLFVGQSLLAISTYAPLSIALAWTALNISSKT